MQITRIHGNIVMPDRVIMNGTVLIEGETIVGIEEFSPSSAGSEDIDATGKWIIPGFVDSHSDAIEIELEPRPSSTFPIEVSFYELEKKLVGEGITTIYHSLSLMEENAKKWTRRNDNVLSVIKDIKRLARGQHLIRHKTHLRYEITNLTAMPEVKTLIKLKDIDQLSFMDHTPGQGQFRDIEVHKKLLMEHRHYSEDQADSFIEESKSLKKLADDDIHQLAELAHEYGVPIASHDDDSVEKLEVVKDWNATISEFPIELEVAQKAKEMDLFVVMGAPNALLGKSHSNNLSAMEAVQHGLVDIFCSDYYPSSLLYTVFKLYHSGMPIYEAVNMVTYNPAKALKIDQDVGSIEVGKKADLLIINELNKRPILEAVLVNGRKVCEMNYQTNAQVSEVY
ncbi:alpha-D-ribose 1-methylphosphonate 5-triphosphate diphosphatase [Alkalihalobacterium chitinilyticum]|uniref:Alpha-D-ribose 1-methylphosphonate 5-triphosphate diphosphatase n=1 Tax=Alkalihalobacterium chitinilyticum TaxID=2980103 RepID=A0ABT5VH41_9BACI|nr:alpha-D-ribose 1-methylphosphonate 5-triphosphate diphosphatase [Alkalihalobacterium chitinilyticum]MDE5414759.1 alpha-D-ribose 1-methylphosphonate 5-triphosphate diphosphatase [Alkalihalobacterium chitinilyticum]